MKIVAIFVSSLALVLSINDCPDDIFPATFLAIIDGTFNCFITDAVGCFVIDAILDSEMIFFKETLKFRDEEIQHTTNDAFQYFNDSFGLDFSLSAPDNQNLRELGDAVMFPFVVPDEAGYQVVANSWIRTGSTRSTCHRFHKGGFVAFFKDDMTLHGTYGGTEGKPIGIGGAIAYGFYYIESCEQSPVLIQYQSRTPYRVEPVDGIGIINWDLYSRVLGYGRAQGVVNITPDPDEPGRFHYSVRNGFTFPLQ